MKLTRLLFAVACVMGIVAGGYAQNAQSTKPEFGYMDRKTGMFHSLSRPLPDAEAPAITPTTGKFVFNVTITVSSALPASAVITCVVSGGVADLTSGEFSNVAGIAAKRSGNTATCTVTIPYSWDLATPAKDVVQMDLQVDASVGTLGTSSFYEESFIAPAITAKVPANGTTTTENIATTI